MVHQIHKFWPWDRTRRVTTAVEETKTAVTIKEETAAILRTEATAKEEIAAVVGTLTMTGPAVAMEIMATVAKASKVFRKRAIIAAGEEIATVAAMASKKVGAASFDKKEKYIWINGNVAAFAWGEGEMVSAGAWRD